MTPTHLGTALAGVTVIKDELARKQNPCVGGATQVCFYDCLVVVSIQRAHIDHTS